MIFRYFQFFNNKIKKILLFLIPTLFIIPESLDAQTSIHMSTGIGGVSSFTTSSTGKETHTGIKGSPYFNKDFMYGYVEMNDTLKFSGLFRYNLFNQEMEFIFRNDTLIIDNPIKIKYVCFAAKKFTYTVIVQNVIRKNLIYGGYFEVLNDGKCQLLIKYEMDFRLNRYVPYYAGGGGDGSYRFIPNEYYYMRLNIDEPALKLKKSKRFILKTFKENKYEISTFMKKNKIDINKKKDLIKLFEYINKL